MKTLTFATVQSRLAGAASINSEEGAHELLAHLVYHALVHGNVPLKELLSMRDSKANGQFKTALCKYLPVKYDKKAGAYVYDKEKALQLRTDLAITVAGVTGVEPSSLDDVSNALPAIFAEKERKERVFDGAAEIARLIKRLAENGCEEQASVLAQAINDYQVSKTNAALSNAA